MVHSKPVILLLLMVLLSGCMMMLSAQTTISPSTVTVPQGGVVPFVCWTASNPAPTCSFSLASGGGTLNNANYTAPNGNGTAKVVATVNGVPSAQATVTISGNLLPATGDCSTSTYPHTGATLNICHMSHVEDLNSIGSGSTVTITRNFDVLIPANYVKCLADYSNKCSPTVMLFGETSHGIVQPSSVLGWCRTDKAFNEVAGDSPFIMTMPSPAPVLVCVEPMHSAAPGGPYWWNGWGARNSVSTWDSNAIPRDFDLNLQVYLRVQHDLQTDPRALFLRDDWYHGAEFIEPAAVTLYPWVAAIAGYNDVFPESTDNTGKVTQGPWAAINFTVPTRSNGPMSVLLMNGNTKTVGNLLLWNLCGNNVTTQLQHNLTWDFVQQFWVSSDNFQAGNISRDPPSAPTSWCNGFDPTSGWGLPSALRHVHATGGLAGTELQMYNIGPNGFRGPPYCSFGWGENGATIPCDPTIGAAQNLCANAGSSTVPYNAFINGTGGCNPSTVPNDELNTMYKFLLAHPKPNGTVAPPPPIVLNPTSLTFAAQTVNTTSPVQTVLMTNNSTGTVAISSIIKTGDFAQSNNCGSSLNAGNSCTISVTFTPTAAGTRTGTITVTHSASGSPQTAALTGTGVAAVPVVVIAPTSLTFPSQLVGTTSAVQSATVTNTGQGILHISSQITTGDYAAGSCGATINPGAVCTVNVTFTPTQAGTRTGAVTFTDDAAGSPHILSLTGTGTTGTSTVVLNPTSLDFGSQVVGVLSAAQTVRLTNTGNGTLTFTSIVVSGDYDVSNNCGGSIAAGASCTITDHFTPTTTGTRTGTVTITDNATGSPQTFALTGIGVQPTTTFVPSSLTFASQVQGTTSPAQSFVLTNTGTSDLSLFGRIVASGDFAQTNNCPTTILPSGANCTVSVTFTPTTTGARTGAITFTDDAPGSPQTVPLSGTGAAIPGVLTVIGSGSGIGMTVIGAAPIARASVLLSPTTLTFAPQQILTVSPMQLVTIQNVGTATLTITSKIVAGASPSDYGIVSDTCPPTLNAGISCTFGVVFHPTVTGTRLALITITDNATGSPRNIPLTGSGTPPTSCASGPGPPLYPCSNTTLTAVGTLTPIFSATTLVNSTGHTPLNPSKDCVTRITDQNTWGGQSVGNVSHSGGDADNDVSLTTQYVALTQSGNNNIFHLDPSGSCLQVLNGGAPLFNVPGPFAFSRATDTVFYWVTNAHIIHQGNISGNTFTETSNSQFPFDLDACPGVATSIAPGTNALSGSVLGISAQDKFLTLTPSWTGGQGTGIWALAYQAGTQQCASINFQTGDWWAFCSGNCSSTPKGGTETTCTMPVGTGTHDSGAFYTTNGMMEVITACTTRGIPGASTGVWKFGTGTVLLTTPFGDGHEGHGTTHFITMHNPSPQVRVIDPLTTANITSPTRFYTLPGFTSRVENHGTIPSFNGSDSNLFIEGSAGPNGNGCVNLGDFHTPAFLCDEIFGLNFNVPDSPAVRFGATYTAATSTTNFACLFGIGFPSQDGKWFFIGSDHLNNLGNDNTGKARCDVFAYKLE